MHNLHHFIVALILATLLPVNAWGYRIHDGAADIDYHSYAGPSEGHYFSGSLQLKKGMTEDGYYARAAIEDLRPENIRVYIRRNRLVVQIAQGNRYGSYNPGIRSISHWRMRIRKQLRLPYDADVSRMMTRISNGIMEIYIPRRSLYAPVFPGFTQ